MHVRVFPSGLRDFIFEFVDTSGTESTTGNALPFLFTEVAPVVIEKIEETSPSVSRQVFLAQLLVNCLVYRGSGRHLVVESWGWPELDGTSLRSNPHSLFQRDLSDDQMDEFRLVRQGESPPDGSLAEVFWDSHVTTPRLEDVFDDPDMEQMALALLDHLDPDGGGTELEVSQIKRSIEKLWKTNFVGLNLGIAPRKTRPVFKRLLSATIRVASHLNGLIGRAMVISQIQGGDYGATEISDREDRLFELRYGGCRPLADINACLLLGCDGMYSELVNDYVSCLAMGSEKDIEECESTLHQYFGLLRSFRERRKIARSTERRERRQRHQDYLPAPRIDASGQRDASAEDPTATSVHIPSQLLEELLPLLKSNDRKRIKALVEADWDRAKAANLLGITRARLSKQWRDTLRKNVREALEELGISTETSPSL